jgi:hypothetical protein
MFDLNKTFTIPIHLKTIFIFVILFFIIGILLFICVSYFIIKYLEIDLKIYHMFFYDYNKSALEILKKYSDYKITKVYLSRKPFNKKLTLSLNLLTLFQYDKLIKDSYENMPFHSYFVFELKKGKDIKLLLVEKNNRINICENFIINENQEIRSIKVKNFTLNDVLNKTLERIGPKRFFNWNLFENNCQDFTKEILITLGKFNKKNQEYIDKIIILNKLMPSSFGIHILNSIHVIFNIIETYIIDSSSLFS